MNRIRVIVFCSFCVLCIGILVHSFLISNLVMFILCSSILTHTTHHIMDLISADMLGSKEGQGSMSFNHSVRVENCVCTKLSLSIGLCMYIPILAFYSCGEISSNLQFRFVFKSLFSWRGLRKLSVLEY